MAKEKAEKKTKRPTAGKRRIQDEKKKASNKVLKSKLRSATRKFEEDLTSKNLEDAKLKLQEVCSLVDKGVKKGIMKTNRAARVKSRLSARVKAS